MVPSDTNWKEGFKEGFDKGFDKGFDRGFDRARTKFSEEKEVLTEENSKLSQELKEKDAIIAALKAEREES